jgi:hypothetical protein
VQDPRHLWWRYLRNNPAFLFHIALQLTGLRRYPAAPAFQAIEVARSPARAESQLFRKTGSEL